MDERDSVRANGLWKSEEEGRRICCGLGWAISTDERDASDWTVSAAGWGMVDFRGVGDPGWY